MQLSVRSLDVMRGTDGENAAAVAKQASAIMCVGAEVMRYGAVMQTENFREGRVEVLTTTRRKIHNDSLRLATHYPSP